MKKSPFGLNELKTLAKRLSHLLEKGFTKRNIEVKRLVERVRFLLSQLRFSNRRVRRIFGTAAVLIGMGLTQNVHAQAAFASPVNNPFGITNVYQSGTPISVDMDNDGDLDLLVAEYYGNFQYYQNNGTATAPAYAAPVQNPFGLVQSYAILPALTAADLDNDGDFDIMAYQYDTLNNVANVLYYQNMGTATAPAFTTPVTNPFGISNSVVFNAPKLVDLDNDGDFDLVTLRYDYITSTASFNYHPNTGTATAPSFGPLQSNPFGLAFPAGINVGLVDFGDLDGDGDMDIIFGEFYNNADFHFYQNTGSAAAPNFAAPTVNPFGLVATNSASPNAKNNNPHFIDMDGDGDLDILSGEYYGNFAYFQNVFTLGGPLTVYNISIGSPSCSPGGDGTVSALAGGGMGPITYKIGTDSNTTGNFMNYLPGTYTLRVRDSVNTFIDSVVTITAPVSPSYDSLASFNFNVTCNGLNNGAIFVSASGGAVPYMYQLLPTATTPTNNPAFGNLGANSYTVIITDANNCSDTASVVLTEPPAIVFGIDSFNNLNCFGSNNGAIYTTATGGSGSFSYSITPAGGSQTSVGDFTGLPANSYSITALDVNGNNCSASVTQTITQPPAITLSIVSTTKPSSATANDGSIVTNASGGTGTLVYNIAPNTGTQSPPGTFTNLGSGNYTITATDATNCTMTTSVQLDADWPISVNNIEKHGIKIFPNPVSNILSIESDNQINALAILDITGKVIKKYSSPRTTINLENLPNGIYMLKFSLLNEETVYMRISKQ